MDETDLNPMREAVLDVLGGLYYKLKKDLARLEHAEYLEDIWEGTDNYADRIMKKYKETTNDG